MVSIDLRKAFDRISHRALFQSLREQNVPESYIQLLGLLYQNQTGCVNSSKAFPILRGVKQGDIISPMLFNAGIEKAFREWKKRLQNHGFLFIENESRFTNTRYADDVMIYGKSEKEVIEMTELLIEEFSKIGLHLNASKTKILTTDVIDYEFLEIGGDMVEILHGNSTHRFLGRHLPGILENRGAVEINHRIQVAWMKYGQFSKILGNRKVSIKLRLKLFDVIVSPVLLFGLSILPLCQSHLEKIDVVERKMLREIMGWVRLRTDDWEITMQKMLLRLKSASDHYPISS